jgi:parvulin-like peptidyl-prolyl isomerase
VERYAVVRKLAGTAITRKLDQQEPYKYQLDSARQNILMQAAMDDFNKKSVVKDEDQQKYYREHLDEFTQTKVSGIFVGAFSDNAQRAADLYQKLKAGGDFGKLAKEHSTDRTSAERDGFIGYLDKTGNYPPQTMKAILALQPGEISEPVALDNGFWIFRLEEIRVKDYPSVQEQIVETLKQKALLEWVEMTRKALTLKVQDESYFKVEMPKSLEPEGTSLTK